MRYAYYTVDGTTTRVLRARRLVKKEGTEPADVAARSRAEAKRARRRDRNAQNETSRLLGEYQRVGENMVLAEGKNRPIKPGGVEVKTMGSTKFVADKIRKK